MFRQKFDTAQGVWYFKLFNREIVQFVLASSQTQVALVEILLQSINEKIVGVVHC